MASLIKAEAFVNSAKFKLDWAFGHNRGGKVEQNLEVQASIAASLIAIAEALIVIASKPKET